MERGQIYYSASSSGLLCRLCRLWLLDPVQTDCGERVCRACFPSGHPGEKLVCPLCDQVVDDQSKPFYTDRAASKHMHQLIVGCDACSWVGPAIEIRQHWMTCLQTASVCNYCQKIFPQDICRAHMLQCGELIMECLCGSQVTKSAAISHELSCPQSKMLCTPGQVAVQNEERLTLGIDFGTWSLDHTPNPATTFSGHMPSTGVIELAPGTSQLDSPSALLPVQDLMPLTLATSQPGSVMSPLPVQRWSALSTHLWSFTPPQEIEEYQLTDTVSVDQLVFTQFRAFPEEVLCSKGQLVMPALCPRDVTGGQVCFGPSVGQGRVDRRLDYAQNTSYDGHFIWKIAPLSEYLDQAVCGTNISIKSVPFYSSPRGYKVCLMLFLQGHGIAQGTHLSLAFMLMRGEYDSILNWPFPLKARMTLLNQLQQGKDITSEVNPDSSERFLKLRSNWLLYLLGLHL